MLHVVLVVLLRVLLRAQMELGLKRSNAMPLSAGGTPLSFVASFRGDQHVFEFPADTTVGELRTYLGEHFKLQECKVVGLGANKLGDAAMLSTLQVFSKKTAQKDHRLQVLGTTREAAQAMLAIEATATTAKAEVLSDADAAHRTIVTMQAAEVKEKAASIRKSNGQLGVGAYKYTRCLREYFHECIVFGKIDEVQTCVERHGTPSPQP
jgi:hypothetical protein